jgi:sugar lactone lactonase YvrE
LGKPDVQCVLRAGALNAECPRWSARESRLYWVDMRAPALHRLDPATGEDDTWPMPDWIGCYAFAEAGRLLAALRTGLQLFDPATGALEFVAPAPYDARRFCFNDGGCDRQGRFHVGPMFHPLDAQAMHASGGQEAPVWRYGPDGWVQSAPPVKVANGVVFSPDGRTMYHTDSARKTIWAAAYDPDSGQSEPPRVFARVDEAGGQGDPDGAAVDREGFYLCAVFGAGCLLRFDPDGRLERRVEVPAKYPTMPAFGGDALDVLYLTSASFPIPASERAAHPDDGALFALEAPAPGLPPTPWRPTESGLPL